VICHASTQKTKTENFLAPWEETEMELPGFRINSKETTSTTLSTPRNWKRKWAKATIPPRRVTIWRLKASVALLTDREVLYAVYHRIIFGKPVAAFDKLHKIAKLPNLREPSRVRLQLVQSCLLNFRRYSLLVKP
jgi:hypothetical protein